MESCWRRARFSRQRALGGHARKAKPGETDAAETQTWLAIVPASSLKSQAHAPDLVLANLYGPWTAEYDGLLKQLEVEGALRLQPWTGGGVEGERISALEHVPLERVISSADVFFRARRHVDTWADRAIPRLLDYVYFETEPMQGAIKMERLDFKKVSKEPPRLYRRTKSGADAATLRSLRSKFADMVKNTAGRRAWETISHTSAQFDEKYLAALAEFEREEQ